MGNSVNRENVPESLFCTDNEEEVPTSVRKKSKMADDPDDDSPEFAELVKKTEARIERRRTKPKTIAASVFNRACEDVKEMMTSQDWSSCGARHLVALYDLMHEKCYGVEAAELGPQERYNAAMMAANMVKRNFDGEYSKAVEYMRWVWTDEIRKEKWRRETGKCGSSRIGIRLMFGGILLTNYRVHLARTAHRK